ncbi:aminotransferase class V-fold PLP-dependent enzyme [Dactylosporangium vinaceum]|uniref:Threonine aldolase family protein n=1 Tax=Dactylosporangium vinaceum TaxID=53362 RepID=A0ABV5MM45_9ACTN|nr:aminotransferase class V-fold PLP-dependent enzyme [Dactylosporangium vinaceum]UAB93349.1 aminotransferase class V-fold PLP-dependent enzyme [Dactylosporangium vinaceum]
MTFLVSDNTSGVHPDILAAIVRANAGQAPSYGDDPLTAQAEQLIRDHFGPQAEVAFAVTGTAANVIALATLLRPYETVLCAETAHIATDECAAPEHFTGARLTTVPTRDGRLTPDQVAAFARADGSPHSPRPRAVSIAQPTELGTLYSVADLQALAATAHAHGLRLHIDGARLANAAAALGTGLAEAATGADIVSLGGTKNGALAADAVIFLDPSLAGPRRLIQKQAMQLLSKGRFVAAQFVALLEGDLWRTNATHANAMAARVAEVVSSVPGAVIAFPVQTNAVFATLPALGGPSRTGAALDEHAGAAVDLARYGGGGAAGLPRRFMAAFDTTEADVQAFARVLHAAFIG